MRHIAVIPARGGSRRLPKKNIIDFMGKPMIAWSIEAAQAAGIFDRILVSTDSTEVAAIAKDYGATVPFMRSRACDDYAPVSEATCIALEQCSSELNEDYDLVTQLMANTPLRTDADIHSALQNFLKTDSPAQISCFPYGWMNPFWALTIDSEGIPNYLFPDAKKKRSQDLPTLYCPTGAVWIARTDLLLDARTFYCPGHRFFPMPWYSAVDIDNEEDFAMARAIFQMRKANL